MANRDVVTRAGKGSALSSTNYDQNVKSIDGTVEEQTGTTYTVVYTDQNKTIELNNASMVCTLTAIATIHGQIDTDNFTVTLVNTNAADATISRSGSDTFIGGGTSYTLKPDSSVVLQTDSSGAIWNIKAKETNKPIIDTIYDTNGNESLVVTPTASAINHLEITNSTTTLPSLGAAGDSTDINVVLKPKGVGRVRITAGLTGAEQGVYVGLDTPESLVSSTSTSSTNWTTHNSTTLNSAGATMAKLRIQTKVVGTGASQSAVVDIAQSGQSGAISSSIASPTVYTSHISFAPVSNASTYGVSEVDVNLDSNNDFQYGTNLTSTAGTISSAYVNIILVGYYV